MLKIDSYNKTELVEERKRCLERIARNADRIGRINKGHDSRYDGQDPDATIQEA